MKAMSDDFGPSVRKRDPLREGLVLLAAMLGRHTSASELGDGMPLADGGLPLDMVPRAMRRLDMSAQVRRCDLDLPDYLLPALLLLDDGNSVVLTALEGDLAVLRLPDADGGIQQMPVAKLADVYAGVAVFAKPRFKSEARLGAFATTDGRHWFFGALRKYRRAYLEVALGAMMANLLAIATALFAMQVYDRVVPNSAFDTLWILASGVVMAIVFEAVLRYMRGHLLDAMGKNLDLRLSTQLFARVLQTRLSARPASLGAFTSQIREFESVREFFTSSSAAIASDLPFTLIFLAIIALIGGPVVLVPIAAIMLMVFPSLMMQRRLADFSRRNLREGAIKNSLLIEAVENLEAIKAGRGEGRAMQLWETLTAQLAETARHSHSLSSALTYGAGMVQQFCYVGIVAFGVYRIGEGAMTVGALVACSLLGARAVAPMSQAAGILARWQHTRVALEGLDQLMAAPVERPEHRAFVRVERLRGQFMLADAAVRYDDGPPVVDVSALTIAAGEKVAILGGNGAGKSTLLRLLSGLGDLTSGNVMLDGMNLMQIDPSDRRAAIGFLPQDVALMQGTLRENLNLEGGAISDAEMFAALDDVGLGRFVRANAMGLDMPLLGSRSLSGGQRQAVGLARVILQDPQIVLLDEATAFFDQAAEDHVVARLQTWLGDRTLVLTTHKRSMLALVERVIVMRDGSVVMDGPVGNVVSGNQVKAPERMAAGATYGG
ncbi:type I secretion system permease/ATPase [Novosphingobium sp. fls2-241-R2A-195]|jgi:ATP-binding cassette subfamily C protein LapB|uniref:type I secretion system permease/ATPase n=1 Tax=Novosphingobium sp. fls2-241-R2A-195 TaxID=3040296 RepID=UPI00254B7D8E|nr:type I secretion system permease/ATPase [Novosphingobium sp. fls2-241-R2A-195]